MVLSIYCTCVAVNYEKPGSSGATALDAKRNDGSSEVGIRQADEVRGLRGRGDKQ